MAVVVSVAVVAVVAGYAMARFDRTRTDAAAAAKIAASLGRLRWQHMFTAVLLLALVVAAVRALTIGDGSRDRGPRQPAPTTSIPTTSVQPVSR